MPLTEQQVKKLAVDLQGAATCLLTAARTLTANNNNSSLEKEKEEQHESDMFREFNSGDLKSFLLRYVETLVENDVIFKNYENININNSISSSISSSSSSSGGGSGSKGAKKDKNQQQNDAKDYVLQYFNSLIENDVILKSFMKPGVLDSRRSTPSTSGKKRNKSSANANSLENDALMEIEELTRPVVPSSSSSKSGKSRSNVNATNAEKRNKIKKPVDPNAPKKPASSFLLYQKDVQEEIRREYPETKWNDILRIISQRWQVLPEDEKKTYENKLQQARKNYEIEYKIYMENKKNPSSNVTEITDARKDVAPRSSKGSGKTPVNEVQDYTDDEEEEDELELDNDDDDNHKDGSDDEDQEAEENGDAGDKSGDDTVDDEETSTRTASKSTNRKTISPAPLIPRTSKAQNSSSGGGSSAPSKKRRDAVDEGEEKASSPIKKHRKDPNDDDNGDEIFANTSKKKKSQIKIEDEADRPTIIVNSNEQDHGSSNKQSNKDPSNSENTHKSSSGKSKDKKKKKRDKSTTK